MFIGCLFFLPSLTYLVLRLKPLLSCHCFLYFPFPLFWDTDVLKPMLWKPVFCNEIRQAIASNRFLIQHMFVFWLGDIFTDIGSRCVFGWSVFFMSLRMKICTYHVSLFHSEAPFQWGCVTWRRMKLFPPEEVFLCAQFILRSLLMGNRSGSKVCASPDLGQWFLEERDLAGLVFRLSLREESKPD